MHLGQHVKADPDEPADPGPPATHRHPSNGCRDPRSGTLSARRLPGAPAGVVRGWLGAGVRADRRARPGVRRADPHRHQQPERQPDRPPPGRVRRDPGAGSRTWASMRTPPGAPRTMRARLSATASARSSTASRPASARSRRWRCSSLSPRSASSSWSRTGHGSGLGESAISAFPKPWRARSLTALPGRCGAPRVRRPVTFGGFRARNACKLVAIRFRAICA
jgi:hypothetical protein